MNRHTMIEKLKADIASGSVVTIAGTGVSVAACENQELEECRIATWTGLLRHAVKHCREIAVVDDKAASLLIMQIENGEIDFVISAAETLSKRMYAKSPGDFRGWLKDTIGRLTVQDPSVLNALDALPGVLATLNYDNLLEDATNRRAVTWQRSDEVQDVLRKKVTDAVLHLHGWYKEPDSIIFGLGSYLAVKDHPHAKAVLNLFTIDRTLLFVGCGETVLDPNFARLIDWGKEALKDISPRHFLLCRRSEVLNFQKKLIDAPWLQPLDFGEEYEDLVPFLNNLIDAPATGKSRTNQSAASIIQRTFACEFREFRGRSSELNELARGLLRDPKRSGVIIGAFGGMGKTALANHFCTAYEVEKHFDIIVGASAKEKYLAVSAFDPAGGGVRPLDSAIRTFREYLLEIASQLGIKDPGARPDKKLEIDICKAVEGTHTLMLIDNLESLDETTAALALLRRLCSPPNQKFLITARELPEVPGPGTAALILSRIERDDARRLICDLLEDLNSNFVGSLGDDNPAIEMILDRADGHPLALRLLTGKMVAQGEAAILSMPDEVNPSNEKGWGTEFFNYVFDETLMRHLGPIAVDVARVVASYSNGVREQDLAEACQAGDQTVTPKVFAEAVGRLRLTFCVHHEYVDGAAVLAMHPLTRRFFARLLDSEQSL